MPTNLYTSAVSTTQQQVDDLVIETLPAQGQWTQEAYLWLTDHSTRLIEFTDVGGYVTGSTRAVSEPLLTLTEQVETAEAVARAISLDEAIAIRQQIEDIIGLEGYYAIEEETVEAKKWGKR